MLSLDGIGETWDSVLDRFNREEDPAKAISVLTDYAESASDSNEKYEAFVRIAHLFNLLGVYEKAQFYFEQAFAAKPDQPDFKMLLYSAALLIELNQWTRAENQIDICLVRCKDDELIMSAYFYSAYLYFLKGDAVACAAHVQKILDTGIRDIHSGLNNYLPWIACFSEEHPDEFKSILSFLKTAGYPVNSSDFDFRLLSPAMILSQQIGSRFQDVTPESGEKEEEKKEILSQKQKLIVAGSYSKRENADAVLKDLEMQGFSGKIGETERDGKEFFRIYVLPIENDYEMTLSFLRKLDIDAFVVNDVY